MRRKEYTMNVKSLSFEEFCVALQKQDEAYVGKNIQPLYDAIIKSVPEVQEAIGTWLDTGERKVLESHGTTSEMLMNQHNINYCAAVLTIDWIKREPQKALAAITRGIC